MQGTKYNKSLAVIGSTRGVLEFVLRPFGWESDQSVIDALPPAYTDDSSRVRSCLRPLALRWWGNPVGIDAVRRRRAARYALAGVRLVNGTLGLVAPGFLSHRLEPEVDPHPATIYAFRMFGVRTVVLGVVLLRREGAELERELRHAVLIHASDTATAASLAASGRLSRRTGAMITAISATNVALALGALDVPAARSWLASSIRRSA
jgi:hypothetical protein